MEPVTSRPARSFPRRMPAAALPGRTSDRRQPRASPRHHCLNDRRTQLRRARLQRSPEPAPGRPGGRQAASGVRAVRFGHRGALGVAEPAQQFAALGVDDGQRAGQLAEHLALALLAAAAGLAVGWLAAPLLTNPGAGLGGTPGAPSLTLPTVELVTAVSLAVAVAATLVPASAPTCFPVRRERTTWLRFSEVMRRQASSPPLTCSYSVIRISADVVSAATLPGTNCSRWWSRSLRRRNSCR